MPIQRRRTVKSTTAMGKKLLVWNWLVGGLFIGEADQGGADLEVHEGKSIISHVFLQEVDLMNV